MNCKEMTGRARWIVMTLIVTVTTLTAVEYPCPVKPGRATVSWHGQTVHLENDSLQLRFHISDNRLRFGQMLNKQTGQALGDEQSEFFLLTLANGKVIPCSQLKMAGQCRAEILSGRRRGARLIERFGGKQIVIPLVSADGAVKVDWALELRDGSNYVRQLICVGAGQGEVTIKSVRFMSLPGQEAEVSGRVNGSPIVARNIFVAYEHPIASSKIFDPARPVSLTTQKPVSASGVFGALAAELAVDGEAPGANSHWGCANLPVWLMVDLQKQQTIDTICLKTYYNNHRYYGYQIESSHDKNTWVKIVDAKDNQSVATAQGYVNEMSPVTARYLKVTITHNSEGNHFGGHIVELEVFGPDSRQRGKGAKRMNCFLDRHTTVSDDRPLAQSSVIGVVPEGQLRRAFLYYLERERAQPYRQYLHYNSWYHLNIGRQVENRMTEPECIETIDHVGRELVRKRGVQLEGFVWDDGWDHFDSLWDFHEGFPHGFTHMAQAAAKYNSKTGVWLSPFGGYGHSKEIRLDYGRKHGYEINPSGFSLAGPVYYRCFRDRCVQVMKDYGVDFFKFDGVGGGSASGGLKSKGNLANDVDAMLRLIAELRQVNPSVYISATTGTWASPYFLFHADNIWRQGGDTGFHGKGPRREQWITYRDMFVYSHVVHGGALYPLNALMPHGLVVGDRAQPGQMERAEQLINNEVWMMFACGANLLELYISPELLTQNDWDVIARAAKWGRQNQDVFADTHWIGGNPASAEVYGYAAWSPRKGTLVLRNPNEKAQAIPLDIAEVFELPAHGPAGFTLTSPQRLNQDRPPMTLRAGQSQTFHLKPFEVLVLDAVPH